MAETRIQVLGQELTISCSEGDAPRVHDLVRALEVRLAALPADTDGFARLARVAIRLLAEAQMNGAALARARQEIDALNDLLLEGDRSRTS